EFVAGFLAQCHEERFLLVVALHEDAIAIKRRRSAGAEAEHHWIRAEVFLPYELAGHIEAIEAGHAEVAIDPFAVGDRCFGCVGVGVVDGYGWFLLGGELLPQDFAGGFVEAVDLPAVNRIGRLAASHPSHAAEPAASAARSAPKSLAHFLELLR